MPSSRTSQVQIFASLKSEPCGSIEMIYNWLEYDEIIHRLRGFLKSAATFWSGWFDLGVIFMCVLIANCGYGVLCFKFAIII